MSADHFSIQSDQYSKFRPSYPVELFDWLASNCLAKDRAWDCACGNGQATMSLVPHFRVIVATDLSQSQLDHAPASPKIEWRLAHAEDSGLESASVDLITVAQALHWFDLAKFWNEVNRVLKPGGVIAVWSYGVFELDDPSINAVCDRFYGETVGDYWPPERKIVESGYGSLPFPFEEISVQPFQLQVDWLLDQLIGYIASWSATARYRQVTNLDPIPELRGKLSRFFKATTIRVRWPLSIRVGRKHGS